MALSTNASFTVSLLLFLLISFFQPSFQQPLCHEFERLALLQFKNSFFIEKNASGDPLAHPKTNHWKSQGIDCCLWEGITCDQQTGRVIHIDLGSSCLFGSINFSSSLFRLDHLQYLNLADNDFNSSEIPFAFGNLSRLTYLNLSHCGLFGKFPNAIFELSKLENLYVHDNWELTGTLPEFHFSNLLKELDVSNTNFSGEFPKSLGHLSSLEYLDVSTCNFLGVLPSSLSNLTNLQYFNLGNNYFQGSMAPFFSNLTQLDHVDLSANDFTFTKIPSLARSTNLRFLDLSDNQISGPFPSWLTNLTQLTYLNLGFIMIQGSLPSSISKLKNLESFFLTANNLSGIVELDTFFELKNLKRLSLSQNSFSLLTKNNNSSSINNTTIPKLVQLELDSCNLKEFPVFLHNQNQLTILGLAENKIHGQVPKWLLKMSPNLWFLDLSDNSLTSFEDSNSTFFPSRLTYLRLDFNFFKGSLPIPPPSISYYSVAYNSFEGEIPPELFCNITTLKYLDLSSNNLSGMIPQCLGNQSRSLSNLNLGKNTIRGKLPSSLANCKDLELLDLSNNQIRDTFPSWLGNFSHLKVLILRSNGFYGAIDDSEFESCFPELHIVDLSHNEFQGTLPLKYFWRWNIMLYPDKNTATPYSFTVTNKGKETIYEEILNIFTAIDLSCNKFSGAIPPEVVGNLRKLELLNLSNNNLVGPISPDLGYLLNLEALDLSNNSLTGRIPPELTRFTFLEVFNVSHNLLTGLIPRGRQFDTFENNSFKGNPGLCGEPLSKKCGRPPPPSSSSEENRHTSLLEEFGWKAVLIGWGFGFLGGVVLGIRVFATNQEWLMETFLVRQGRQRRGVRRPTRQIW